MWFTNQENVTLNINERNSHGDIQKVQKQKCNEMCIYTQLFRMQLMPHCIKIINNIRLQPQRERGGGGEGLGGERKRWGQNKHKRYKEECLKQYHGRNKDHKQSETDT